jgi:6-phosphogluconolactonase
MNPDRIEILHFGSPAELATNVAERWISNARQFRFVALSGGRIPQSLFSILGSRRAPITTSELFWADERCVPPGSTDSNYRAANELLLEPLAWPHDRVHRIRGEAPPNHAALEAEAELCRIAPLNANGCPVLDLVLLGMGEDGHVASLFPGESDATINHPGIYRTVIAAKPPPQRVTISYGALRAANEVWVLISGSGKEQALKDSLNSPDSTPLGRVLQGRLRTVIFHDLPLAL